MHKTNFIYLSISKLHHHKKMHSVLSLLVSAAAELPSDNSHGNNRKALVGFAEGGEALASIK